jgi:hypothetical protein|tara:strand:+ start:81 stop:548 length:468 start_codon:yes stop_codon:yes gene_type:complete
MDSTYKEKYIADIDKVISDGHVASDNVPPLQTKTDLYDHVKVYNRWIELQEKIKNIVQENIGMVKLTESWANISREDNRYGFHTHKRDITAVYYLKNNYTNYGTQIDDKVIIPGLENSVLIFDGKINHSIINMPFELAVHPHNNRYSVVFDYDTI